MPWTSNHFQESTILELLIEFMEDHYDTNPGEKFKDSLDEDGNIVLETGDPLIDKWEQELAKGLKPDLTEAFDRDEFETVRQKMASAKGLNIGGMEEFVDNYNSSRDNRYSEMSKLRKAGLI